MKLEVFERIVTQIQNQQERSFAAARAGNQVDDIDAGLPEPVFSQQSIDDDHPVNGVYRGGSDHRKDGQAVGW